jgi:hypothetical protein
MKRVAAVLCCFLAGCAPTLIFYDVTRTPTRECEIFPDDEFCDELSPPVTDTWSVEQKDDQIYVYADGDVWIADAPAEDEDPDAPRVVVKRSVVASDVGCTTTTERRLSFTADGQTLTGTLDASTRLEGPPDCGDTPRGETHAYALAGTAKATP